MSYANTCYTCSPSQRGLIGAMFQSAFLSSLAASNQSLKPPILHPTRSAFFRLSSQGSGRGDLERGGEDTS